MLTMMRVVLLFFRRDSSLLVTIIVEIDDIPVELDGLYTCELLLAKIRNVVSDRIYEDNRVKVVCLSMEVHHPIPVQVPGQ